MGKKEQLPSNSGEMSNEDALELLEKTSEQYRVYSELHDIAKLAQDTTLQESTTPSEEYPLNITLSARK